MIKFFYIFIFLFLFSLNSHAKNCFLESDCTEDEYFEVSESLDMIMAWSKPEYLGSIYNFNEPIGNWDTSNVTSMVQMFWRCREFNQDISGWNVSKVTSMRGTFSEYSGFNQDISSWNISSVDDMRGFLKETEDFNQDLSGWNVDGVTQCDEFILNAVLMTPDKVPNFTNCDPSFEDTSSDST